MSGKMADKLVQKMNLKILSIEFLKQINYCTKVNFVPLKTTEFVLEFVLAKS